MSQADSQPDQLHSEPTLAEAAAPVSPPLPRRRWCQFSLRTLLVFMVAASVLIGTAASVYRRASRQARAVETLKTLEIVTHYDAEVAPNEYGRLIYQWRRSADWPSASSSDRFRANLLHDVVVVDGDLGDAWPRRRTHGYVGEQMPSHEAIDWDKAFWGTLPDLVGLQQLSLSGRVPIDRIKPLRDFRRLRILELTYCELDLESVRLIAELPVIEVLDVAGNSGVGGDEAMEAIGHLPRLKHLGLSKTSVTDSDLAVLAQNSRIESLDLACTSVSARGLAALRDLRQLRRLSLRGTAADDSWEDELAQLTQLESLDISHTPLSGRVMESLARLPRLRELCTSYTNITGRALNRFQEKNPTCKFVWTER